MEAGDRIELIRELCAIGPRGAGTDAERRSAKLLVERLRAQGRRARVEPIVVRPAWALALALTAAVAIGGGIVALWVPAFGFALILASAATAYLDLDARLQLERLPTPRRASQNVVSPGPRPRAPVRLVLCAHYDAPRAGYLFGDWPARAGRWLVGRSGGRVGPLRILFWGGIVPLLPIAGARMAGLDATWLDLIQLPPTAVLVVAVFLLADLAFSPTSPAADANAAGVAVVLEAAAELDREPPQSLDVWVLLTGAGAAIASGMRAFLREHRRELDRERTLVVCVEGPGQGLPRYRSREGALLALPADPELSSSCEALAAADPGLGAGPAREPVTGDAHAASIRGLRAISITTLDGGLPPPWRGGAADVPERVDAGAVARVTDLVVALARLADRELSRDAAPGR